MVGETLSNIRVRIEELATADGDYCVVCGRTMSRPVPVTGKRFPDREAAEEAAAAAATYRATLRRWDPRAPCYDFIACEVPAVGVGRGDGPGGDAVADGDDPSLTGFCHDVAAAVLETLSARGHDDVESAVMEAYCTSATAVEDPDELCLHLLRTLAVEVDVRLSAAEQRGLLRAAADELVEGERADEPIPGTFDRLVAVGLVDDYTLEPTPCPEVGRQCWTVTVEGYALAGPADGLPTLPVALDLLWRLPRAELTLSAATSRRDRTWEFTLTVAEEGPSEGLLRTPVDASS